MSGEGVTEAVATKAKTGKRGNTLYARIGRFLDEHCLEPDPFNYEFAYRALRDPDSSTFAAVKALTEGGVRLTRKDMVALGAGIGLGADAENRAAHDAIVARTQLQVESFADLVRSVRAETSDFGRDLAASADAMRDRGGDMADDIVRIAGSMVERVRTTESRLEAATREAAELRHKLEQARDDARRDPLTGLPNRRAFEEAFAKQAASRTGHCIAVCDVDRFKAVNDNFGHAVGDRVLKAIGDVLLSHCTGHVVARYGGEEFAILFVNIAPPDAEALLDEARRNVAGKRYRLRETDAPLGAVTFSAGLTQVKPGEGAEDAFIRADALLYQAKEAGRNRIICDA